MKFQGYRRGDGSVGIRNHVLVIPGVLCADVAARRIAASAAGSVYIYNPNGCGQNHRDAGVTLDIIAGLIANGNVYGALIVGLGCEMLGRQAYLDAIRARTDKPVHYISIQEEGGIARTAAAGRTIMEDMLAKAGRCVREEIDLAELILGLECGGSDTTSGLSANAVLGRVTDRLIDAGGTALLSETSEAIGAEHLLRARGRTPQIGEALYRAVTGWEEDRYRESGEDVRSNNPSPGNRDGGLTTLSEKSLGCLCKSGSRPFDGCYEYGQMVDGKGLYFVNATAYDPANTTALAAAGAQLIAFTTGRGNPVGNPVAPVVKITGNRQTAEWMEDFIDIDTSASMFGEKSIPQLGEEMLQHFLRICDGALVKAEINGANEISINQNSSYV